MNSNTQMGRIARRGHAIAVSFLVALALGGFGAGSLGCLGDKPSEAYFVKVDRDTTTALYELGLDDESYAAVVAMLGAEPAGLGSIGPRENGEMIVRFEMAPAVQSSFVDQLLAFQAGVGDAPEELSIFIGDETTAVGLLLPAVQSVRASGVHRDENDRVAVFFEVSGGDGKVEAFSGPMPARPTSNDSFFDISFDFDTIPSNNPAEKSRIDEARGPFETAVAAFGRATLTGTAPTEELAFYYTGSAVEVLIAEEVPAAGVVDVITKDGRPVMRMSVLGAQFTVNQGGTIELSGGEAHVITYTGLENASTDNTAEVALFQSDYQGYDSSAVDLATRNILALKDALAASGNDALTLWHGGAGAGGPVESTRAATTANLVKAVINAFISENLACTMATPDIIKAGKDPVLEGNLDRDIIRRVVKGKTALAALIAPTPGRLHYKLKDVLVSSLGDVPAPEGGDTVAQCNALEALGSALESETINFSTVPAATQAQLETLGTALAKQRAAYLDRLVFEFVTHMNARLPTDVGGEDEWTAAAKTKADILIESLGNEAANGPLMHSAAKELLGQ